MNRKHCSGSLTWLVGCVTWSHFITWWLYSSEHVCADVSVSAFVHRSHTPWFLLFFKHEGLPIDCLTSEQWCTKWSVFKMWNGKILKLTVKLCVMTGSSDCILYLCTGCNCWHLSVCCPVKQGQRHRPSGFSPTCAGFRTVGCMVTFYKKWAVFSPDTLKQHTAGTNITVPKLQYKEWKSPRLCEEIADRWFPVTTELSPVLWWMWSRFDVPVNLFSGTELLKTLYMIT